MTSWRPRLVARRPKGGVPPPTTTSGFLFNAGVALILVGALSWLAVTRGPHFWLPVLVAWWPLRDAVAWLLASEEERAALREQAGLLREQAPPTGLAVNVRSGGKLASWFVLLTIGAFIAAAFLDGRFLVAALFFLAIALVELWDAARKRPL